MRNYLLQIIVISLVITVSIVFGNSQKAFAQGDFIIDLDGITTSGKGVGQEVSPGDDLVAWPTGFPPDKDKAGIDWVDRNRVPTPRTWNDGDSLFSEDPNTCSSSSRDTFFNGPDADGKPVDCVIFQGSLGPIPDMLRTDCDLETGGSPSGWWTVPIPPNPFCQDESQAQLTFFDTNMDGFWTDGEDIILDRDGDGFYNPSVAVGGKLIPIDVTMVLIAGTQTTIHWLIPVVIAGIGLGLVIVRKI